MTTITTARTAMQLKSKVFRFADGSETVHRYAVFDGEKRIGTVHHCICGDAQWFDPFRGTGGKQGDGKVVTKDFMIQRKASLQAAIAAI